MILRPDYINRIKPFIGLEPVKVLTGLRRSGKSVMLKLIQDEIRHEGVAEANIITFNFENMNTPRNADELHKEIVERVSGTTGKLFMFFDEIQEVENWEKCINSLRVEYECDIYITGSNAKLLSGELATYLAGRYVEFVIYPFSFKEFLRMPAQSDENISSAFRKYLLLGGMPFLSNIADNPEACNLYLTDIYNSVILKDIVRRHNIRDVDQLERVITYVLANIGHSFSATSLSKYFKSEHRTVSHDTILNYTKACAEAFLFFKINREDLQGKKILTINEKYYVADHGMRKGKRLNTATLKQLCSTDKIHAERKFEAPFEFNPSHSLVLYTNYKPEISANDIGTWRRIIIIPFKTQIGSKQDIKNYSDYLFKNAGGAILK